MNKQLYKDSPIYKRSFDMCVEVLLSHATLLEFEGKALEDFKYHLSSLRLEKLIEYELMMRGFAINRSEYNVESLNKDDMLEAIKVTLMQQNEDGKYVRSELFGNPMLDFLRTLRG